MFHEMPLKLYFMKCYERKFSQCIFVFINLSENLLKLKKGQRLAEITIAEFAENKPVGINSVCSNNFDIKEIDLSQMGFTKKS